MKAMFFVHTGEVETARKIEKILLSLPEDTGILFVSASVIQDPRSLEYRKIIYRVIIGCNRSTDIELINVVAQTYLRQEVNDDAGLNVEVYRGFDRLGLSA